MLTAWRLSTLTSITTALSLAGLWTLRGITAPSEEQFQKLLSIEPYNVLRAPGHTHVRNVSRTTGEDADVVGGHVVVR